MIDKVHIKDAAGQIIRSVGVVQDVTERKKAEEEARKPNIKKEERDAVLATSTALEE